MVVVVRKEPELNWRCGCGDAIDQVGHDKIRSPRDSSEQWHVRFAIDVTTIS